MPFGFSKTSKSVQYSGSATKIHKLVDIVPTSKSNKKLIHKTIDVAAKVATAVEKYDEKSKANGGKGLAEKVSKRAGTFLSRGTEVQAKVSMKRTEEKGELDFGVEQRMDGLGDEGKLVVSLINEARVSVRAHPLHPLIYSLALQHSAQSHANTLSRTRSNFDLKNLSSASLLNDPSVQGQSQTIFIHTYNGKALLSPNDLIRTAMESWISEKKLPKKQGDVESWEGECKRNAFDHVICEEAREVGIAFAMGSGGTQIVVARYWPAPGQYSQLDDDEESECFGSEDEN